MRPAITDKGGLQAHTVHVASKAVLGTGLQLRIIICLEAGDGSIIRESKAAGSSTVEN